MSGKLKTITFILFTCLIVGAGSFLFLTGTLHRSNSGLDPEPLRNVSMPVTSQQGKQLVSADSFLQLLRGERRLLEQNLEKADRSWDESYVPMLLEVAYFMPLDERMKVIQLLTAKTGKNFGLDFDKWMQWDWQQDYPPHPQYAEFKSSLYGKIDPRFVEYFEDTDDATILLNEIRWGGVRRDGIPPLKNPKMLTVSEANYLADSDVVFGIELNGDARAYPKRILAWHEMFKDTIGGESVCGVY